LIGSIDDILPKYPAHHDRDSWIYGKASIENKWKRQF